MWTLTPDRVIDEAGVARAHIITLDPGGPLPTLSVIGGVAAVVRVVAPGPEEGPAWLPRHRAAWQGALAGLEESLAGVGVRPVLWPRVGDAISDTPSAMTWLRSHPSWGLLLDMQGLLAPGMEREAANHAVRWVETLGEHPGLWGVVEAEGEVLRLAGGALAERRGVPRLVRVDAARG